MTAEAAGEGKTAVANPARRTAAVKPIRTLIDPRLDFKVSTPLRQSYIVASSMRSGSTFLCTALWQTGVLGAPWEYINSDNELGNLKARYKASTFAEYLPRLLARRTSKNGVFGMKAHFHHFRAALEEYPPLLEDLRPVSFVYIDRLDKLAQAVSMAKARQTKSWISLLPSDRPSPEYNRDLITKDLENAERQSHAWLNWFDKNDVTPFTVTYEDMLEDKDRVVRSIMEMLGVLDDDPDVVALPPVSKQADEANETWIARYKSETGGNADIRSRWRSPQNPATARLQSEPLPKRAAAPRPRQAAKELAPKDLMDKAWIAFIYGFPSYEMARLRHRALSNPASGKPAARPNTFRHARTLINPANSRNSANNVDTIYSGAWLDLSLGPLVIRIPKMNDRYFSLQFMDFFTNNFAVLGRDTEPGDVLIAGPRQKITPSDGMKLIRSPTNAVWVTLRILADDLDDLPSIHALQDQFTIKPRAKSAAPKAKTSDPLSMPVFPLERAPDPLVLRCSQCGADGEPAAGRRQGYARSAATARRGAVAAL
jgi:LPS sulfotransferase NodH